MDAVVGIVIGQDERMAATYFDLVTIDGDSTHESCQAEHAECAVIEIGA